MNSKSNFFKTTSVIFIFIALYLIFNSISYIWVVYSSSYNQVGLVITAIAFLFTIEIGIIGVILLLMPFINLFSDEASFKKMLQSNFLALLAGVLIIQVGLPGWNFLITVILFKIFGLTLPTGI